MEWTTLAIYGLIGFLLAFSLLTWILVAQIHSKVSLIILMLENKCFVIPREYQNESKAASENVKGRT